MTKKHYFVLRNIDPVEIDTQYSFYVPQLKPIVEEIRNAECTQRTKITDLAPKQREQNTFSYLDESKKEHTCVITMVNQSNNTELPIRTTLNCYWCRHSFDSRPLGCPIQYVPNKIVKSYYSEITKDNYILRENVSIQQLNQNINTYKDTNMDVQQKGYYVTDGIFCSFNCCLSFIQENRENPLYTYSENLLRYIYLDLFGNQSQCIIPAPSWRLLHSYGGSLSIDDFRKNFYKIDYKDADNPIYPSVHFHTIGFLYEKQIRI